ncbi:MAG: LuxR family maltose regulon positive regulatory protein [Porticoccaceae bacterium]|jgi:LuxR family maltose regulon positive regulatory protein
MAIKIPESKDSSESAEERLESMGGWRVYIKAPVALISGSAATVPSQARKYPRATIATAFLLAKMGDAIGARKRLNLLQPNGDGRMHRDNSIAADLILVDTHVKVYEDRALTEADSMRLTQLLSTLPADDLLGQALTFNHLSTAALHRGEFDRAQDHAENAIRFYSLGGAQFGSLHMYTHLGQIRMMRGDLAGAKMQYEEMEGCLAEVSGDPQGLRAICRALKSEVAYEMNELNTAQSLLDEAVSIIEDTDAWLDVFAATYRVRARLAFANAGLPGALTELAHADAAARDRNMPRLGRLMCIERIRAFTLSGEINTAFKEMVGIGLDPNRLDAKQPDNDWGLRHGTTNVTIARWLVRAQRPKRAMDFVDLAEETAIRGGQLLTLAKLRVIRAQAYWRLNARPEAIGALLSAIRLLGNQPFRRFILDEGADLQPIVQAALDRDFISTPISAAQRRRLSEFTHSWSASSLEEGGKLAADYRTAVQKRYLELLAQGHSNKEISRVMGVSVNTVKYHLKHIFRDMHVDSRARAVSLAREIGMIDL